MNVYAPTALLVGVSFVREANPLVHSDINWLDCYIPNAFKLKINESSDMNDINHLMELTLQFPDPA